VTVTISGNDIGFSEITRTCAEKSFSDPFGSPCKDEYTEGGTDQLAERINAVAGPVDAVLDGIHERAPQATVVLVGYLRILPPDKFTMAGQPGGAVTSGGGYLGEELRPLGRQYLRAVARDDPAGFLAGHPELVHK